MVTKEMFSEQLRINGVADKFFVMVKTDPYIDNFKMVELKESSFKDYELISYRGIFPVVQFISNI